MKKQYLTLAIAVLIVTIGAYWAWDKWAASTRVAFVNYQATTLGQIAKANSNPFIKIHELPVEDIAKIGDYDMVFINGMGLRITEQQRELVRSAAENGTPILTTAATNPDNNICSLDSVHLTDIKAYLAGGGRANYGNMLEYVRKNIDSKLVSVNEPAEASERSDYLLYHPDVKNPDDEELGFNTLAEYHKYLRDNALLREDAASVIVTGVMGDPTELILALEREGKMVYNVSDMRSFINKGCADSIKVNAVINLAHGRMGDYMVEWLAQKNIPLFAPINVNRDYDEWMADKMGMSGGFLSQSVVTPEIDGAIRPFALFAHYKNSEGIPVVKAIPGRLDEFVATVGNYINLQQKSNPAKRVAIVYYKGPGANAMTAAGMEVAPSLFNTLRYLQSAGYNVDNLPETSKDLEAEIQTHSRLQYGNIALVRQPLPNHGDNEFKIIHGTDQDPEDGYISTYKWISDTLQADALIHFGTHGSLEFTPRKQVALGNDDWADRLVGTMPHFYIYSIGDVGEGMIAKRRSYGGLQSHLTAPFLESNLRDEYKGLMDRVKAYNAALDRCLANNGDPTNNKDVITASLAVKKVAVALGLHRELELDSILVFPYNEDEVLRIENFAEELATEKISGQLYVMGIPYEQQRIISSLYAMATDPIAYSRLALDKLRDPMAEEKSKHKSWFTRHYLDPASATVTRFLSDEATDTQICELASITQSELNKAREIDRQRNAPSGMMAMMMAASGNNPSTQGKMPMDMMSKKQDKSDDQKMDPNKALEMAKQMGASKEQLEKMKAAMGDGKQPEVAKPQNPMASMMSQKQEYSKGEVAKALAILEVERTVKNIGKYRMILAHTPQMELGSLVNAMNGGYTKPSPGGDPIVNPNTLPTGRNLYGINAEATPSELAWEKGKTMADNTIKMYRQRHNDSIPRKVSYTLWSGEFIETEGATIAQVLYMLGVEPIRDAFGRVTDLRLIPSSELGRPRIDVVVQTSGQLRDLAASRLFLINQAVQMAAEAADDEHCNQVAEGVLEAERTLVDKGVSPKDAREMAIYRVFGGVNGGYGTGIQGMVMSGDRWESEAEIADVYLNNMGAFYGDEKKWEVFRNYAFEAALTRTDAVVQPRQSNTWGALSLDHVYEFMGGLNLAVRNVTGKDPDAYLSDYRNRNNYRMQEVHEAIGVESRATIFNPTYIKEKMKGEASSAASFAEIIENTYGWNVMKPKAIDNEMWDEIYNVYVKDKFDLGIKDYFDTNNHAALQEITAVMMESARKGMWMATEQQLADIAQLHTELVTKHGAGGSQMVNDNAKLRQFIAEKVDPETATAYKAEVDKSRQADGKVLKKETLNESDTTGVENVGMIAIAVVAVLVVLGIIMVAVRRRRNRM